MMRARVAFQVTLCSGLHKQHLSCFPGCINVPHQKTLVIWQSVHLAPSQIASMQAITVGLMAGSTGLYALTQTQGGQNK